MFFSLECWAGTVSIAVIRTLAVFRALVPTSTFGNLVSGFASLRIGGKHISFAAAKLVRLLKCESIKWAIIAFTELPYCDSKKSKICSQLDEDR